MRRWIVLGVLAATGGVGAAVYLVPVGAIRIEGTSAVSPNSVLAASGLRGGERIFWLRTGRVATRIETFPSVAAVQVRRELPATIVIRIVEREAVVVLGRGLAADGEGAVFARPPSRGIPALIGWRAPARPGARLDDGSRAVLRALRSFPADLHRRVVRISLLGAVTMLLNDGTEIRFGQPVDLVAKARAAVAVLGAAARQHRKLAYVDVRAPSVPASRDRTPPTPSPAASPTASPAP